MDKLRAIQYFNRAVESGSFAAAARSFVTSARLPSLTSSARSSARSACCCSIARLEDCLSPWTDSATTSSRKIEADLCDLEQRLGQRDAKPRGTLKVAYGICRSELPRSSNPPFFLTRFPDIELVITPVVTIQDIEKENLDISSARRLAAETRPRRAPSGAGELHCLRFAGVLYARRTTRETGRLARPPLSQHAQRGRRIDGPGFETGGERRTIDVNGRLLSDDRLWLEEAAALAPA